MIRARARRAWELASRITNVDRATAIFILLVFVALSVIATRALHSFPHSADEWDFVFQARHLEHLHVKSPPLPAWTRPMGLRWFPPHVINAANGVFGKYPPGWPAVLAIGAALGAPALCNPLLGAVLLAVTYMLVRRIANSGSALMAIVLLGTSSFFVINASSFHSHVFVSTTVMVTLDAIHRWISNYRIRDSMIAAIAYGVLVMTRPFDAALLAPALLAIVVWAFGKSRRERRGREALRQGAMVAVTVLAFSCALLAYNAATTANPLVFGHMAYNADPAIANQFKPASPSVIGTAAWEWDWVAMPLALVLAATVYLLVRPGALSRKVMAIGVLVAVAPWLGYAFRPPPQPIHYGPRYQLTSWPIAAAFLGTALARIPSVPVTVVAVALSVAWQLAATVRHTRDLSITLYRGMGVERAKHGLAQAIAPKRAVLVVAGSAGSVPPIDLARNESVDAPVLLGAGFPRGRVDRAAERSTFVWDGLPGLPMVFAIGKNRGDVAQVVLTDPPTIIRRSAETSPTEGWLVTWNRTPCALADSRRKGASAVSMPGTRAETDSAHGPCAGAASGVATSADGSFTTSTGGPVSVQLRAFVVADEPGSYVVEARSDGTLAGRELIVGDHDELTLRGDVATATEKLEMLLTGEGLGAWVGVAASRIDGDVHLTISLPAGLRAYSQVSAP